MRKELETILLEWMKTVPYKGEQAIDTFGTGPFEDLEDRNAIITVQDPLTNGSLKRGTHQRFTVSCSGKIFFLFRRYDKDGNVIADAEDRFKAVPDITIQMMAKSPSLGKRLQGGRVDPKACNSDINTLLKIDSVIYYASQLNFEYSGRLIESEDV
jgi:hypothetical protein